MKRAYAVRRSRAAGWARLCGGLAVPMLVLAALGTRVGLIPAPALLLALILGFVFALLAFGLAVYALADVWNNGARGARIAVAGMVYALPALALLGVVAAAAVVYPRLVDVTTNPDDPPEFSASGGPDQPPASQDIARQLQAYPDLVTRTYPLPLGQVYAAARHIIEDRGWTIVRDARPTVMPQAMPDSTAPQAAVNEEVLRQLAQKSVMTQSRGEVASQLPDDAAPGVPPNGQGSVAILEATAPTPVFGFRDDVVVRLVGTPQGTDVDLRSASGLGEHDLGQNARRIRRFFAALDAALQPGRDASGGSGIASVGQ
jgi:hypothetical protein